MKNADVSTIFPGDYRKGTYGPDVTRFANNILNHTATVVDNTLYHYGNGYGTIAGILRTDSAGSQRFSSYTNTSGPNSVFVVQTYVQNCRTGTLLFWDGIEKQGCRQNSFKETSPTGPTTMNE